MKDISKMKKTLNNTIISLTLAATAGVLTGEAVLLMPESLITPIFAIFYISVAIFSLIITRNPRKLPRFGRDILIESCQGEYHIGRDPFNPTTLIFAFYLIDRDDPYYGDRDEVPEWETDMDHPDFVGRGYLEELTSAYDLCEKEDERSYLNKLIKKLK